MEFHASTHPTIDNGTIGVVGSWDPLTSCHFSLWEELAAEAARRSMRPLVATISPLPQAIIRGPQSWPDTDDLSFVNFVQRLCGISCRLTISLSRDDLSGCTPKLVHYLKEHYDVRELWLGRNQSFGSGPDDSHQALREICNELGVAIVTMPFVASRIPAHAVRGALAAGNIGEAVRLLGRPIFRAIEGESMVYAPWKSGRYRGQVCSPDDFEFVHREVTELNVELTRPFSDVWIEEPLPSSHAGANQSNGDLEQWVALSED